MPELLTLPEHMSSPMVLSRVRVVRSLVLCVCFVDRCLSFFFWPLCYLSFDLRILITHFVSSNSSCSKQYIFLQYPLTPLFFVVINTSVHILILAICLPIWVIACNFVLLLNIAEILLTWRNQQLTNVMLCMEFYSHVKNTCTTASLH